MMITPQSITHIVVGTVAFMSLIYVATLSYCVIAGISTNEDIMQSFQSAGMYVLGALTGMLVNTRSQQTEEKEKPNARTNTNSRVHTPAHAKPKPGPTAKPNTRTESISHSVTESGSGADPTISP